MPAGDDFDFESANEKALDERLKEAPTAASQRSAGLQLLDRGHFAEAQILLRNSIHAARAEGNTFIEQRTMEDLASAVRHHSPRAALRILRSFKELSSTPCGLNLLAIIHHETFSIEKASALFSRALEKAQGLNDKKYAAYATANISSLEYDKGNYKLSIRLGAEALEGLRSIGDAMASAIVLCNAINHEAIRGNYEEAMTLMDRDEKEIQLPNNSWVRGYRELICGEIESVVGDRVKAIEHFSRAHSFSREASDAAMQAKALAWRAVLTDGQDSRGLIQDLNNAAQDLFSRGLRSDGAFLLLIAAKISDFYGRDGAQWAAMAYEVLGEMPIAKAMESHYERIVQVNKRPQRPQTEKPFRSFLTQALDRVQRTSGQACRHRRAVADRG